MVGTVTLEYNAGSKLLKIGNDFLIMTGPGLYVYLTNTIDIETDSSTIPDGVEELGELTSAVIDGVVTGASVYNIPQNINIKDYKYVLIQCKAFNVFWGFSVLGESHGASFLALSVEDEFFNSISFYPNPANNNNISFETNFYDDIEVKIFNSIGTLAVKNESIGKNNGQLSLANISSGICFVELTSNRRRSVKKLIMLEIFSIKKGSTFKYWTFFSLNANEKIV